MSEIIIDLLNKDFEVEANDLLERRRLKRKESFIRETIKDLKLSLNLITNRKDRL